MIHPENLDMLHTTLVRSVRFTQLVALTEGVNGGKRKGHKVGWGNIVNHLLQPRGGAGDCCWQQRGAGARPGIGMGPESDSNF